MEKPVTQPESPYELNRRLENLVRVGTVMAVRTTKPARCRVKLGDNTTDWLPWSAGRAGGQDGGRSWWPPVVGEQCMVLCPGGDLLAGVVIPGLFSDAMDAPSDKAGCDRTEWAPRNFSQWLDEALHIRCEKEITLQVGDNVTLTLTSDAITLRVGDSTNLALTSSGITLQVGTTSLQLDSGGILAMPDIVAGGKNISLVGHMHTGVIPGPGLTGAPK